MLYLHRRGLFVVKVSFIEPAFAEKSQRCE